MTILPLELKKIKACVQWCFHRFTLFFFFCWFQNHEGYIELYAFNNYFFNQKLADVFSTHIHAWEAHASLGKHVRRLPGKIYFFAVSLEASTRPLPSGATHDSCCWAVCQRWSFFFFFLFSLLEKVHICPIFFLFFNFSPYVFYFLFFILGPFRKVFNVII
jgi:hypothetical protein